MAADPFSHFSNALASWSIEPPLKPANVAEGEGLANRKRQSDLLDKVRARLANESAIFEDRNVDPVETARRLAAAPDNDDDPDLPD